MKKMLSTVVAALAALSFAGIVCAAEPAMPPGHPPINKEAKPAAEKKVKKAKKAKKVKKEAATPATPATPAAPAAK